jgi:hypothetical protein
MVNVNKAKGDRTEAAARDYYRCNGFPFAERTRAGYTRDAGDLHLCPGVITQVKNCQALRWTEWFIQLTRQRREAKADVAWLTVKRPGMGDTKTGQWLAVMTVEDLTVLLRAAGYGSPLDTTEQDALATAE